MLPTAYSRRIRTLLVFTALALLVSLPMGCDLASQTAQDAQPTAADESRPTAPDGADTSQGNGANEQQAAADAPEQNADPFAVPDGTADRLIQYIQDVQQTPEPETDEQGDHQVRIALAVIEAAERILSGKATETGDDHVAQAATILFQALLHLRFVEHEGATEKTNAWFEKLASDRRLEDVVLQNQLLHRVPDWDGLADDDRSDVVAKVAAYVAGESPEQGRVQLAMMMGQLIEQLGDSTSTGRIYLALAKALAKSEDPDMQQAAPKLEMNARVLMWPVLTDEEKAEFQQGYAAYLTEGKMDVDRAQMALMLAQSIEEAPDSESAAAAAYKSLAAALAKSEDEQLAGLAEELNGKVRYLGLVGGTMDITGTLLDGSEFDWAAYKGKVVLVDYWATWCRPCLAELPNVIANYERYHDLGFEIVGISLDNDKSEVEGFIEERGIAWPILYSDDKQAQGWDHPMVTRYGITGIPAAILVDRDGKVVTLKARGEKLGTLLQERFGDGADPVGSEKSDPDGSEKPASDGSPAEKPAAEKKPAVEKKPGEENEKPAAASE